MEDMKTNKKQYKTGSLPGFIISIGIGTSNLLGSKVGMTFPD